MQTLLPPLHTLVAMVPLPIQCIVLSTLFLGWFGAHLAMEYAATVHRPARLAGWFGWLCGLPMMLLVLVLLIDTLWTHGYDKVRPFGGLAVVLLLVCTFSQHACRAAANNYLYTAGHTDASSR